MGLLSTAMHGFAETLDTPAQSSGNAAPSALDEDEEDDEEEQAVDYRDRVREVQQWLNNRRGSERRQAGSSEEPPGEQPAISSPFPKYFEDNGYDELGYRKLGDDVRVKLRNEDQEESSPRHYRRYWLRPWRRQAHSWRRLGHSHPHESTREHGHSRKFRHESEYSSRSGGRGGKHGYHHESSRVEAKKHHGAETSSRHAGKAGKYSRPAASHGKSKGHSRR